jgi:hypothetical protein
MVDHVESLHLFFCASSDDVSFERAAVACAALPFDVPELDYGKQTWFMWVETLNDCTETIPFHDPTSR